MKKNIIKISLLLILLLFIFNINTFATINTNYGDFEEYSRSNATYMKEDNYYIILDSNISGEYKIFIIPKNIDFYLYKNSENKLCVFNKESVSKSIFYGTYNNTNGYTISERSISSNTYYSNSSFLIDTAEEGSFEIDGLRHLIYSEIDIYNGAEGFVNNDVYVKARVLEEQPPTEEQPPIEKELTIEDIALNINKILTVLTFIIIIFSLFNYLKPIFKFKK